MQPNYLCKNIYGTCCCAAACAEQQLVFTFPFPAYRLSCVGCAQKTGCSGDCCTHATRAQVRGPNIQRRQKLSTSCLPDNTSSAVVEGSGIFKFKEEYVLRTEKRQKSIPLYKCSRKIFVWALTRVFFFTCASLWVTQLSLSLQIASKLCCSLSLA